MSFTVPLPPRTQLYHRSCSNKHTLRVETERKKGGSESEGARKAEVNREREREVSGTGQRVCEREERDRRQIDPYHQ